jgi:hypothetical protein
MQSTTMNSAQTSSAMQMMQECIRNCEDCHMSCMRTVQHCLTMGGAHADPNHIGMMLDCADICRTSADFMLRNSPNHSKICRVCGEICMKCADDCERIAGRDSMMLECAKMCRQCAESCRNMAPTMA